MCLGCHGWRASDYESRIAPRKHLFIEHAIGALHRPMTDADLEAKFPVQADAVLGKA
jgi:hypothetical protein